MQDLVMTEVTMAEETEVITTIDLTIDLVVVIVLLEMTTTNFSYNVSLLKKTSQLRGLFK